MEAELWPLFGGRQQYMSAPLIKVRKHQIRWRALKQAESEASEQVDKDVEAASSEVEAASG